MSFSNNVVRVLIKLVRVVAEQQLTNVLFTNVAEYNLLLLSSYLYIAEVAWTNKGGNSLCHNLAVYKKWYLITLRDPWFLPNLLSQGGHFAFWVENHRDFTWLVTPTSRESKIIFALNPLNVVVIRCDSPQFAVIAVTTMTRQFMHRNRIVSITLYMYITLLMFTIIR